MKIVNLPQKTNHSAIDVLKEYLEKVESGEIVSIGIVCVDKFGSIGGEVSYANNKILMWAALEHMANWYYDDAIKE
jgi:hypothetical protein